jgi:hypothetical protein
MYVFVCFIMGGPPTGPCLLIGNSDLALRPREGAHTNSNQLMAASHDFGYAVIQLEAALREEPFLLRARVRPRARDCA